MTESGNDRGSRSWPTLAVWIVVSVVALPIALVGVSYLEYKLAGTHHVEDGCRVLKIHEPIRLMIRWIAGKLHV
jgi:hypothetical protein